MRSKTHVFSTVILVSALSLGAVVQEAGALQPASVAGTGNYLVESEGVSIQNPSSIGDMGPRLLGSPQSVRIKRGNREVVWTGLVHSQRGAIQMWGEGLLNWTGEDTLQSMDQKLKAIVDSNFDVFKIKSKEMLYSKEQTAYSGPYRTITYDRVVWLEDAVRFKVEKAFVTFRFKNNRLIQITNHSYGELGIFEAPVYGPDEALNAAATDVMFAEGIDRVVGKVEPQFQPFFIRNGEVRFRIVYQVTIEKKNKPRGVWHYSVSAADASIVRIKSGLHTAQVSGTLYPRRAADGFVQVPLPFVTIRGNGGKDRADEHGQFFAPPTNGVLAELTGPYVGTLRSGKAITASPDMAGDIRFGGDKDLDAAMAYFHITRVNRFVSQFIKNDFLGKPIKVNLTVKGGGIDSCNAWYNPGSGDLNFLAEDKQCVNSATISDVLYHEWGHALDDSLGGIRDDAFSEGIGDITSFLLTHDSRLSPGFFKGSDQPIRDAAVVKVYPRDRDPNPHKEGGIIAGAWWEFLTSMMSYYGSNEGAEKTAAIFFKHLVSAQNYLDSYQAALVIDDDDADLSNCTPHMCLMNVAFAKRGLTPYDSRCKEQAHACSSTTLIP